MSALQRYLDPLCSIVGLKLEELAPQSWIWISRHPLQRTTLVLFRAQEDIESSKHTVLEFATDGFPLGGPLLVESMLPGQ